MLQIGEFSALTGLTVEDLRDYGARGVLLPADVDPATGHRRYSPGQVCHGVLVRTLLDAGVSPADLGAQLAASDGPAAAAALLATHRAGVLEARGTEDEAAVAGERLLAALQEQLDVAEREAPAVHYVAWVASPETGDADDTALSRFMQRVAEAGIELLGGFWTTARARTHDTTDLALCWPVAELPADDWPGPSERVGTLPARTELVAGLTFDDDTAHALTIAHAPMLALLDAMEARGIEAAGREVRQQVVPLAEDRFRAEVVVTVGEPAKK